MATQNLLTRKDIAALLGLRVRVIKDNERRLGIDVFKVRINHKSVFYQGWKVLAHLKKKGWIPE